MVRQAERFETIAGDVRRGAERSGPVRPTDCREQAEGGDAGRRPRLVRPLRAGACAVLLAAVAVTRVHGKEIKPLFDVRIDHEFANPQETFEEILALIQKDYYTDQIDEKSLWWGAVEGVLRRLSPEENKSLAAIWAPQQFERINESLTGVQESIGIRSSFNPGDGSLTVSEVLPGGPSVSLLQPFDRIVRVDGSPLKGVPVKEIDNMLKGEVGTRVSLKVVRDVLVFDLLVTRAKVKVQNVEMHEFPNDVAYASIRRFADGVSVELKEKLSSLDAEKAAGVLLDLRGNSGGVFAEGLKCSELFIPQGKSLMRIVSHGSKINNYVSSNEEPLKFRLVVLVDGGSASASEIVAAALRDEARAIVVGAKTYGKATMEKIHTLKNKYRVKFTTAALYSPKGKSWQRTGIVPDFAIAQDAAVFAKTRGLPPQARLARDQQLWAAYQLLTAAGK